MILDRLLFPCSYILTLSSLVTHLTIPVLFGRISLALPTPFAKGAFSALILPYHTSQYSLNNGTGVASTSCAPYSYLGLGACQCRWISQLRRASAEGASLQALVFSTSGCTIVPLVLALLNSSLYGLCRTAPTVSQPSASENNVLFAGLSASFAPSGPCRVVCLSRTNLIAGQIVRKVCAFAPWRSSAGSSSCSVAVRRHSAKRHKVSHAWNHEGLQEQSGDLTYGWERWRRGYHCAFCIQGRSVMVKCI
jgi:hypothetical protein